MSEFVWTTAGRKDFHNFRKPGVYPLPKKRGQKVDSVASLINQFVWTRSALSGRFSTRYQVPPQTGGLTPPSWSPPFHQ